MLRESKSIRRVSLLVDQTIGSSEASRVADVVGDHDGGVEGLEVENDDRILVEGRLRLHDERDALGSVLTSDLERRRKKERVSHGVESGEEGYGSEKRELTSSFEGVWRRSDSGLARRNINDSTLNCDPRM